MSEVTLAAPHGAPSAKLRAKIETQTEARVLEEASRINRAAAGSTSAPTAEVLTEVFDTPDEVWPVSKVRTVVMSLFKDYMRLLMPYLDLKSREIAADAPTDDDLRAQLIKSSALYATLARTNQHATWFKFFTDRTRSKLDREAVYEMMELRVAVENGRMSEEDAKAQLSHSRAGVLAKARALEKLEALKVTGGDVDTDLSAAAAAAGVSGKLPSKKQVKEARAAVEALKRAEAPARHAKKTKPIPPALLATLRARTAAVATSTSDVATSASAVTRADGAPTSTGASNGK